MTRESGEGLDADAASPERLTSAVEANVRESKRVGAVYELSTGRVRFLPD